MYIYIYIYIYIECSKASSSNRITSGLYVITRRFVDGRKSGTFGFERDVSASS